MADAHGNFAVSAVVTAPSPATSGTSLVISAGNGAARFPMTPPYNAVICPAATDPTPSNAEVVRVTARTSDTFTITRAQEGSVARTVVAGDRFYAAVTAKTLTDAEAAGVLTGAGTPQSVLAAPAGSFYGDTNTHGSAYYKSRFSTTDGWQALFGKPADYTGLPTVYVGGDYGNDSWDGLSPGSSKATFAAALALLPSSGGTIVLGCRILTEAITVGVSNVRVVGLSQGSSIIRAPSSSADCITITGNSVEFRDVTTRGAAGTWTGIGWKIEGGVQPYLDNCGHDGTSVTINGTSGGTAMRLRDTEGGQFSKFHFSGVNYGVHFAGEASEHVFINTRGTGAYVKSLLIDGLPASASLGTSAVGGNLFLHWKTGGGTPGYALNSTLIDIGPDPTVSASGGDNIFIGFDGEESAPANDIIVRSSHNQFVAGGSISNATYLRIVGDSNIISGLAIQGAELKVSGNDNIIDSPTLKSAGIQVNDTGINNIFTGRYAGARRVTPSRTSRVAVYAPIFEAPTTSVGPAGGATALPATPVRYVPYEDPTTRQTYVVPAYLPSSAVYDTFTRADSGSSLGTADSGQAWTANSGTWGIASNRGYHAAANADAVATLDSGLADCVVELDYAVAGAGGSAQGFAFRLVDGSNYWRATFVGQSLQKVVSGTPTTVDNLASAPVAGDHMKLILNGSRITILLNGEIVCDFTDSTHATATKHGFYSNFDTTARYDNFRVTA